jgi:hypothetical protein
MPVHYQLLFRRHDDSVMSGSMQDWLVMGIAFAGTPALALAGRWDEVAAGETLPRACGPERPARPALAPEPAREPAPAFLRLCRVDEGMDADRRARRHEGLVRAGY